MLFRASMVDCFSPTSMFTLILIGSIFTSFRMFWNFASLRMPFASEQFNGEAGVSDDRAALLSYGLADGA